MITAIATWVGYAVLVLVCLSILGFLGWFFLSILSIPFRMEDIRSKVLSDAEYYFKDVRDTVANLHTRLEKLEKEAKEREGI